MCLVHNYLLALVFRVLKASLTAVWFCQV